MLKQVLYNLLTNALKFTPRGVVMSKSPHVAMAGTSWSACVMTELRIAPIDHGRIFDEFQQVGTALYLQEGTGLGLAISRRFVELHGGESHRGEPAWRAGSTFTVTLPRHPRASATRLTPLIRRCTHRREW